MAERAVAMAKLAPEDPYCGLVETSKLKKHNPDLQLYDSTSITPKELKERALEVEASALNVKGILQAEGANASHAHSEIFFQTSSGFSYEWMSSRHSISVSAIAELNGSMERDYDYHSARWLEDLRSTKEVGQLAGSRAIARIGSKQIKSGAMPIIFDKRISNALLSALLGAISGPSVARGVSFLKDKLGLQVFDDKIQIIDDPQIIRGHGSRLYDGEGIIPIKRSLIKNGVLQTWLLNSSSARQLNQETTGHASRNISSPPGVSSTNAYIANGSSSPEEIIKQITNGLLITEMFGPSLNGNTGDYSVGVSGFKIENGQKAHPVSEVTVAGNLSEIYKSLTAANDLEFNSAIVSPTLLAQGLTVAGL
jgi:PmbA protein